MARPSKYETNVKPHLKEIEKWCLTMEDKQIAKTLGISVSTWCEYKKKYPELSEAVKRGRTNLVADLKSSLIEKAKGFRYTESKEIIENGVVVRKEVYERAALPDVAAINLLLKNYDRQNWANDPQALDLRREELELHKKQLELKEW
jgi:hypothetical protein